MTQPFEVPAVQVRVSARARSVRLRVSMHGAVEVVVPSGFDHAQLSAVLADAGPWIRRAQARAAARRATLAPEMVAPLPHEIHLAALGRRWGVEYRAAARRRARIEDERLILHGPQDMHARHAGLHTWLLGQGRSHLPQWLEAVSAEAGLCYTGVSVRRQRSRWGSCSSRATINLNCKLLFLPPTLVRHVLLHELCHTRHMNHSSRFHALLRSLDPHAEAHRAALAEAWRHVPMWAE